MDRLRPSPPIDFRQRTPSLNVRSMNGRCCRTNHTSLAVGAAQGLNQAAQCIGAILIAPLIKKWPTRSVLSCAILFFGLMTTILLIVDATTGGSIRHSASSPVEYGSWNPNAVSPIKFVEDFIVPQLIHWQLSDFYCVDASWYRVRHGRTDSPCHVRNFFHFHSSILILSHSPADIVGGHVGKLRRLDATVVRNHCLCLGHHASSTVPPRSF